MVVVSSLAVFSRLFFNSAQVGDQCVVVLVLHVRVCVLLQSRRVMLVFFRLFPIMWDLIAFLCIVL